MTLVDTSVWVDHLRAGNARLRELLLSGGVWCHPFVIGELACGNLASRSAVLAMLGALPEAESPSHAEVLAFMDARSLAGRGLGWHDMHLLAAARLARVPLWTLDRRLAQAADDLGLSPSPSP